MKLELIGVYDNGCMYIQCVYERVGLVEVKVFILILNVSKIEEYDNILLIIEKLCGILLYYG